MKFCLAVVVILFAAAAFLPSPLAAAGSLPLLHAQGADIVDPEGHVVVLTGLNLGGWLVEEPWMLPFATDPPAGSGFSPITDHVSLWATVEKRFGAQGMGKVRTAFRNTWITEADFKRIHDEGFNVVRLPFLASLVSEPNGMHWLDQAIAWAGENNIYVILDMHGAPGSQSDQDHTGQTGLNMFFKDPAYVTEADAIWTKIAARYRNNNVVAGYDTLNEPMGTPNSDTLYVIQDQLYHAIRAGDPNHIIYIEDGYTGVQWMPFPGPCGWVNVAYSTHYYDFGAKSPADQQNTIDSYVTSIDKERLRRNIPFYVGEYGLEPNGTADELADLIKTLQAKHISSTMWTYKVSMAKGGQSFWGLYSNADPITQINAFTDSQASLINEFTQLRTENLTLYANEETAFKNALITQAHD
jgi:aryl-phospho-beta-D-glucosidase BglC (GH1 family)